MPFDKIKKLNDRTHWNGRELTGINTVEDTERTRHSWRNLVLSVYQRAVTDKNIILEDKHRSDGMYAESITEEFADVQDIDNFLTFKTEISKFYRNFIDAYNSMYTNQVEGSEKLT